MIQFGSYEFYDWENNYLSLNKIQNGESYYCGAIFLNTTIDNKWMLTFNTPDCFAELHKTMYGTSHYLKRFNSFKDGQDYVNKFVDRLVNLKVFL